MAFSHRVGSAADEFLTILCPNGCPRDAAGRVMPGRDAGMSATTRNFDCPETEAKCIEPDCLRDRCILKLQEDAWEDRKEKESKQNRAGHDQPFKTDEEKLKRRIQTVGMEFFVSFYPLLSDMRIGQDELVRRIRTTRGYAAIASNVRVSESRKLISEGRTKSVLTIISQAEKVDETARRQAIAFLNTR
jgi:hypothetical protein